MMQEVMGNKTRDVGRINEKVITRALWWNFENQCSKLGIAAITSRIMNSRKIISFLGINTHLTTNKPKV